MKRILQLTYTIACLFLGHSMFAQNAELSISEKHAIRAFVNDLQYERKELVAAAMHYPMERLYPLKPIIDEKEFIEHYDEFIDTPFIESVKSSEWERIGWRGICCGNGIMWGNIDENGEFYTYSYRLTQKGKHVWREAVDKQRERLYQGLRSFEEPVFMFSTTKYTIRVDLMQDNTYRYASWNKGHDISTKPDLIITKGELNTEGSLHLEYYSFKNGDYEYEIGPGVRSDGYEYELTVSRKGNLLMSQQGNVYY